jgi:molybdopterin converting factor small subunit
MTPPKKAAKKKCGAEEFCLKRSARRLPAVFDFALAANSFIVKPVHVRVHFYSYFKDLAGAAEVSENVAPGSTLEELLRILLGRFPKLAAMRKSVLIAVGVDYQGADYVLQEGDEVSLFPPVQGG